MGYLYKSHCYSTVENLKLAIFSEENSTVYPLLDGSYYIAVINYAFNYANGPTITITDVVHTQTGNIYAWNASITAWLNKYTSTGTYITSNSFIYGRGGLTCSNPTNDIETMNITLQNPPDNFNPSNLNPVDVFNSIGSGFLLVAVPLAVVWAGRHFLRPLFSR